MREGLDRLEARTRDFAIAVIRVCAVLDRTPALRRLAWQLNGAAGSVAANHRAMRRARSMREFVAKLQIVNEEVDECVLWLEMAQTLGPTPQGLPAALAEARELRAIFAKARSTVRRRTPQA